MGKGTKGGLQWPVKNRGCTDIICCFLFFLFFLGFIVVAVWAYITADPSLLLQPVDSEGNVCGIGNYTNRPYLFFFDLTKCSNVALTVATFGCPTTQVCVDKCPNTNYVYLSSRGNARDPKAICIDSADRSQDLSSLVKAQQCAAYYVKSKPIVNRCVPEPIADLIDEAKDIFQVNDTLVLGENGTTIVDSEDRTINSTILENAKRIVEVIETIRGVATHVIQDVEITWKYILVFLGGALLVGLALIILLRFIAGFIVWFVIFLFTVVFGIATAYCFIRYKQLKDHPDAYEHNYRLFFDLNRLFALADTWLALGIISAVILGVSLLIVLALWKRILIAVAVIKQTSKALSYMMSVLVWPIFPLVFQVGFIALAFSSFVHILVLATGRDNKVFLSINSSDPLDSVDFTQYITCDDSNSTLQDLCRFVKYGDDPKLSMYVLLFQVFTWVWIWCFISALSQLVLAGAFASYYWAFKKPEDLPALPLLASVGRAFRYHLGSIAFGSLIIAILRIIQVILQYLRRKFEKHKNAMADFLLKCLSCCFFCLEKIVLFINKNAYIIIAIRGTNFCSSAKQAFTLLLENVLRVIVVDGISWFLIFLCKLTVTAGITVLAGFFFSQSIEFFRVYVRGLEINYFFVPVIIVFIGSFTIAHEIFTVFNMGVNTIFLSFLADLKHNDGSPDKPYYMSKELMGILGKKNKKRPEPEDDTVL